MRMAEQEKLLTKREYVIRSKVQFHKWQDFGDRMLTCSTVPFFMSSIFSMRIGPSRRRVTVLGLPDSMRSVSSLSSLCSNRHCRLPPEWNGVDPASPQSTVCMQLSHVDMSCHVNMSTCANVRIVTINCNQ